MILSFFSLTDDFTTRPLSHALSYRSHTKIKIEKKNTFLQQTNHISQHEWLSVIIWVVSQNV